MVGRLLPLAFICLPAIIWTSSVKADSSLVIKTLTIVVGSSPGGGYDAYGRMLARTSPGVRP
jgi:tripartite-type tricarboxylate transporter receptor subunit TctC